ncbi:MAG: inositol-3-phosphate synthase [Desulfobacterales bacterium]|nr:inositol-3-phosphate synthase [Desulfobacterales bacterium]
MTNSSNKGVLILAAGIRGAIGSTLAAAVCAVKDNPDLILPYLMTGEKFDWLGKPVDTEIAGWDISEGSITDALARQGVLQKGIWRPYAETIDRLPVKAAPEPGAPLKAQVEQIKAEIKAFMGEFPDHAPVLVNLLPAGNCHDLDRFLNLSDLYAAVSEPPISDIPYVLAAVEAGVPVVNFTPNAVEIPSVVNTARETGVPIAGRDGKTGQTYFKVVLAAAFRARALFVNGWYSLNILGNADGENLMDPEHAACKLENKTDVLADVLGYSPGMRQYGKSAHKVHIDYYPPRGDAKEAWDVIDFESIFGLPMSLRLNLQGRDSILAAPMVLDLSRWAAAAKTAGCAGLIPELAFYFKKTFGDAPASFEGQLAALDNFENDLNTRVSKEF